MGLAPTNTDWLFVYGTLQPSFGNSIMLRDAILEAHAPATTPGTVYWVYRHGGYPVAKLDANSESLIIGTLLLVDTDEPGVQHAHEMEIGAGYSLVRAPITTLDGEVIEAMAYHYADEPRGYRILSGDWAKEQRRAARARR